MLDALFVTYSSDGKVLKNSIVKDSGGKLFCSKMEELTVKPKATSETFYARFGLPTQGRPESVSHVFRRGRSFQLS